MGEIGRTPGEFRYGLRWWEIRSIIRGYNRRSRDGWSQARWSTFYVMSAMAGGQNMREAGITKPSDLLPLPWDKDFVERTVDVAAITAEIEAINAGRRTMIPKGD